MAKEKKQRNRYKIILYNETTLYEEASFHVTSLNIFAYIGLVFILIAGLVTLLLIYTPLNSFLPSVQDDELRGKLEDYNYKFDSITKVLNQRDLYFKKISAVMDGRDLETYEDLTDTVELERKTVDFTKSKHDSILRTLIEEEEAQALAMVNNHSNSQDRFRHLNFFMPVKGIVTNKFNASENHLGIDIVAKENEPILATLPGTVTLATWSIETGHVIQIQHQDNIISIYKHNSTLLKKVGDKVEAGEAVAIIGNSGDQSSGPHLHFEIWHNGVPLNPEDYIAY